MINREEIIEHLKDKVCVVMEGGKFEEGEFYQNMINFELCYVPNEPFLDEITYCSIFYELKIPAIEGLENSLSIFQKFRENALIRKEN
jgi:hypothetical protein